MKRVTWQTGLLAVICSLLISSCKLGRNYVRPETNLADTFRDHTDNLGDTVNIADIPWSDFFTDSMLTMLIDSAITNNFDMQAALKNIEIANQSVRQSRAALFPQISAELGGTNHQWRSSDFYSSPSSGWYEREDHGTPPEDLYLYQSQYFSSISMSWELDIWGKLRRQKESALAQYLQTFEARKAIQTSLVAAILP